MKIKKIVDISMVLEEDLPSDPEIFRTSREETIRTPHRRWENFFRVLP